MKHILGDDDHVEERTVKEKTKDLVAITAIMRLL